MRCYVEIQVRLHTDVVASACRSPSPIQQPESGEEEELAEEEHAAAWAGEAPNPEALLASRNGMRYCALAEETFAVSKLCMACVCKSRQAPVRRLLE
jgi:hypothetical protein